MFVMLIPTFIKRLANFLHFPGIKQKKGAEAPHFMALAVLLGCYWMVDRLQICQVKHRLFHKKKETN